MEVGQKNVKGRIWDKVIFVLMNVALSSFSCYSCIVTHQLLLLVCTLTAYSEASFCNSVTACSS